MKASNFYPLYGAQWGPESLFNAGGSLIPKIGGNHWFVDGTKSASGNGLSAAEAFITIQEGIDAAQSYDVVHIFPQQIVDYTGDPTSYTENLIIPFTKAGLSLVGEGRGLTQGGLPQVKVGSTTTDPILKIRAPGCLILNMGFNGSGGTGGGILLDDDYATKSAFGTTIMGSHFKNCVGTTATSSKTGGAIMWPATGNAWQVRIEGNRFYKNVGDVVLMGTSNTVPQDVIIKDNTFSGPAASVDCNLYLAGGSGMNGVVIDGNIFQQLPALSSGAVARFIDATGCTGMLVRNYFGAQANTTGGTTMTWLAAGTAAKIPTTMHVAGNWGQCITAGENGSISIGADT